MTHKKSASSSSRKVHTSASGLVTAVAPVVIRGGGLWVGWPGLRLEDTNEKIPESDPNDKTPTAGLLSKKIIPINAEPKLFDSYYNGCCNSTFWPLFLSMPDKAIFNVDHWKAYVKVNKEFAKKTIYALRLLHNSNRKKNSSSTIVWVHDYHLMLAAKWIRRAAEEEGIKCKLAFFLHIPFPSWNIFRLLPWFNEVLRGILECDTVGFHITDYCLNFIDCCQKLLGCRVDKNNLLIAMSGRTICVRALPIGVPFCHFVQLAQTPKRMLPMKPKVILGVDRLDYTKGLIQKFYAFERLLEKHPEHIEKVVLLQISVPSRIDVKEYQDLKEEIDNLVKRINARFTTRNWIPIKYIYDFICQEKLAALYRDSAVALVTPLSDGMNLVAKEFVACQINKPPGVLIISPFAGAAEMMLEALICNPYEVDDVADVIHRALIMPESERTMRMNHLRRREQLNDVYSWMRSFLKCMDSLEDNWQKRC